MNLEELQTFLDSQTDNTLGALVKQGSKARWESERDEMRRHYEGKPVEAIEKAFPNEDAEILKYRIDNYEPVTRSPLFRAIDEIWRMFTESRHSITVKNEEFSKYSERVLWDGHSFTQWLFRVGYAYRVVDPNGYICVKPKGKGLEDTTVRVDLDLCVINSVSIVHERHDLIAWKESNADEFDFLSMDATMHYMTDEVYATSKPGKAGAREMKLVFNHKLGRVPCVKLGGRTVVELSKKGKLEIRQISDFTHALSIMNRFAVIDSQCESVTYSSCFPFKFINGVSCAVCAGNGVTVTTNADGTKGKSGTCKTCKGSGKVFPISPLSGYFVNPPPAGMTADDRKAMMERPPIQFVAPPIDTIKHLSERRDILKKEVEDSLDIQQNLAIAQSAVSKEQDRQGSYIQLARISDYWFNVVMKGVLEIGLAMFEPVENQRGEVIVVPPVSFDIKDETSLLDEFITLYEKAPLVLRFSAFADYVKRRFTNDSSSARAAMFAVEYSPLTIANAEEKRNASQEDLIKSTYAMPLLLSIARETNGFIDPKNEPMEDAAILAILEAKIKPYLDKIPAPIQDNLGTDILNKLNVSA